MPSLGSWLDCVPMPVSRSFLLQRLLVQMYGFCPTLPVGSLLNWCVPLWHWSAGQGATSWPEADNHDTEEVLGRYRLEQQSGLWRTLPCLWNVGTLHEFRQCPRGEMLDRRGVCVCVCLILIPRVQSENLTMQGCTPCRWPSPLKIWWEQDCVLYRDVLTSCAYLGMHPASEFPTYSELPLKGRALLETSSSARALHMITGGRFKAGFENVGHRVEYLLPLSAFSINMITYIIFDHFVVAVSFVNKTIK